jgi:hypothetical protein
MHVWGGILLKVHYNAVFGGGKKTEKPLSAEARSALRSDLRMWRPDIRRLVGWVWVSAQLAQAEAYAT